MERQTEQALGFAAVGFTMMERNENITEDALGRFHFESDIAITRSEIGEG